MPITVGVAGLLEAVDEVERDVAKIATAAMRGATTTLKETLRDQIRDAGMGNRLANTWRAATFPDSRDSLNPAGYAWSNAPDIIDAFSRGATIAPLGGKSYLWLPTNSVPRAPGSSRATSTNKMTPDQVLKSFGAREFVIKKGKGGRLLAFIVEGRGRTARGAVRRARKGRIAHGGDGQLVLMFVLMTSVHMPKIFDLQGAGDEAAGDFLERFQEGSAT